METPCPSLFLHTSPRRDLASFSENPEDAGNGLQPLLGEVRGGAPGGLQRIPRSQLELRQQGNGRNPEQMQALAEAWSRALDETQAHALALVREAQAQALARTQAKA